MSTSRHPPLACCSVCACITKAFVVQACIGLDLRTAHSRLHTHAPLALFCDCTMKTSVHQLWRAQRPQCNRLHTHAPLALFCDCTMKTSVHQLWRAQRPQCNVQALRLHPSHPRPCHHHPNLRPPAIHSSLAPPHCSHHCKNGVFALPFPAPHSLPHWRVVFSQCSLCWRCWGPNRPG